MICFSSGGSFHDFSGKKQQEPPRRFMASEEWKVKRCARFASGSCVVAVHAISEAASQTSSTWSRSIQRSTGVYPTPAATSDPGKRKEAFFGLTVFSGEPNKHNKKKGADEELFEKEGHFERKLVVPVLDQIPPSENWARLPVMKVFGCLFGFESGGLR